MEKSLKRLSIFFVFIFLVCIFSVNYHHRDYRLSQDDSIILDTVDDSLDLLTIYIYQALLTPRFITTIIISKKLFTLYILTCNFFARAPPA
jgi:hypothetical protein